MLKKSLAYIVVYCASRSGENTDLIVDAIETSVKFNKRLPEWYTFLIDVAVDGNFNVSQLTELEEAFSKFYEACKQPPKKETEESDEDKVYVEDYFSQDLLDTLSIFVGDKLSGNILLLKSNLKYSYLIENICYWLLNDYDKIKDICYRGVTLEHFLKREADFLDLESLIVSGESVVSTAYRKVESYLNNGHEFISTEELVCLCNNMFLNGIGESFVVPENRASHLEDYLDKVHELITEYYNSDK